MDKGELLQRTRWDILRSISQGTTTASAIAAAAGTSLPNVSQQLRLLEAHNIIEAKPEKRKRPGKPRQQYGLKRPICHLKIASNNIADELFISMNPLQELFLSILFLPADEQPFIMKGLCEHDELLDTCSVAYIRSADAVEILLLTEDVDKIRSKYSNIIVSFQNKSRKIAAWTHDVKEINAGVERKDEYFLHLLKNRILYDPAKRFPEVMQ